MQKIERGITGNEHFEKLRAGLEAEGFALSCLLQAKTVGSGHHFKYPDMEIWHVLAMGGKSPAVATIVVRDIVTSHGDGLGLWVEASSIRVEENIRQIIGRMANVGELDEEEQKYGGVTRIGIADLAR